VAGEPRLPEFLTRLACYVNAQFEAQIGLHKYHNFKLSTMFSFSDKCEWDTWEEFTECNPKCGSGTKTRKRTCKCLTPPCKSCVCKPGADSETVGCTNNRKCPEDCVVSIWSTWKDCAYPVNCSIGERKRTRIIVKNKVEDGAECPNLEGTEPCPNKCDGTS
jgi:hypothetical protein